MNRTLVLAAAAAFTVGGLSYAQQQPGQPGQPQPPTLQPAEPGGAIQPGQPTAQMPEGLVRVSAKEAQDLRDTLAKVSEAVVKQGDMDQLLSHLTKEDRERISEQFKEADQKQIKDAVTSIQQHWKEKYSQDFSITQEVALLGDQTTVMKGDIANPALLGNWPVKSETPGQQRGLQPGQQPGNQPGQRPGQQPGQMDNQAQPGQRDVTIQRKPGTAQDDLRIGAQEPAGQNRPAGAQAAGEAGAQDQANVAVIRFAAHKNLPETYASFIKQDGQWKIDLPDDVTGKQLHERLVQRLTALSKDAQQWPADQTEAYRYATQEIVACLYGTQPTGGQAQRP